MKTSRSLSPLDQSLLDAIKERDFRKTQQALFDGANPDTRRVYPGLARGEPLLLFCVREGLSDLARLLIESGAQIDSLVIMAAALLVDRASRQGDASSLQQARRIIDMLHLREVDWDAKDRLVVSSLSPLEIIEAAQPSWATGLQTLKGIKKTLPAGLLNPSSIEDLLRTSTRKAYR